MLAEPNILNYSTKRGYIVALRQDNNQMQVDAELEAAGYTSKSRAKKFNKVWHPYLPREVSAMQWLILTEGLPVGAWRAKIGLPSDCQLCPAGTTETLQHAFQDCPEVKQAWVLLNNTRVAAGLRPAYITWLDISRGLMQEPEGPSVEDDLRWDTTVVFSNNNDTPWDILRAQLLWAIWCQRVAHAFSDEVFHLGVALWNVWRNTIYCAIEAYKELFRHKRNEEKRQELISCFQQIWIGLLQTFLADYGGRKLNGTSHLLMFSYHGSLVRGWCHLSVCIGPRHLPTRRQHSLLGQTSRILSASLSTTLATI